MVFAMISTLLAKNTLGVFLYGFPTWPSQYKIANEGGDRYSILDTLQGPSSPVAACNISMLEGLWVSLYLFGVVPC